MIAQYKWDTLDMLVCLNINNNNIIIIRLMCNLFTFIQKKGNTNQKSNQTPSQFFTLRRGSVSKPSFKTPKEFISALSGMINNPLSIFIY